ncbi:CheR family methyltransferase [Amphibiibacter pelophylacis]|uniref:Protein-glutamate O-methyltransferase CheR n=1 Tax=Amphibiibacter pelophylacis TaxID=1799477 RepID=A0ACC6P2J3_9BURK
MAAIPAAAPGHGPAGAVRGALSDAEFTQFRRFLYEATGISLASTKKALVFGRLSRRLQACGLTRYSDYLRLLQGGKHPGEVQMAIDLLTTNETYFFREPRHFEQLRLLAQQHAGATPFRVWSAACSSGEEVYTIAMVLADTLGERPFEVLGTDISQRMLERARTGHYSQFRARHIPPQYLKRFCLKGHAEQAATILISRALRSRVRFAPVNLNAALPRLGPFDAIFLRNVMIYFTDDTKRAVIARVLQQLKPGGHLFVGHSESLLGLSAELAHAGPAQYRRIRAQEAPPRGLPGLARVT